MRRFFRNLLVSVLLGTVAAAEPAATPLESGQLLFRTIGAPALQTQDPVSTVAVAADGHLLLSGRSQVVEFDGVSSRTIPLPQFPAWVDKLAPAPDGRTYACDTRQVGWFTRASATQPATVAMLPPLPRPPWRRNPNLTALLAAPDGLFALGLGLIARWRDDRWLMWPVAANAQPMALVLRDRTLFSVSGQPLQTLRDDRLVTAYDSPLLRAAQVLALKPASGGGSILVNARGELLELSADGAVSLMPGTGIALVRSQPALCAAFLTDGSVALGTQDSGLLLLDARGRLRARLDQNTGLQQNRVATLVPSGNALWLVNNEELLRVDFGLDVTRFDQRAGLPNDGVLAMARHEGRLYAATGDGVRQLDPGDALAGGLAAMAVVPGLAGRTAALLEYQGRLFAGGPDGVYELKDGGFQLVAPTGQHVNTLAPGRPGAAAILVGVNTGVGRLRLSAGGFHYDRPESALGRSLSVLAAPDGAVWSGGRQRAVTVAFPSAQLRQNGNPFLPLMLDPESFLAEHSLRTVNVGLDGGVAWWRGAPLAYGGRGLFRLDAASGAVTPLSPPGDIRRPGLHATRLFSRDSAGAWFLLSPDSADPSAPLPTLASPADDGYPATVLPPPVIAAAGDITDVIEERAAGRRVLWIAGSRGLVRVALNRLPPLAPMPAVSVTGPAPAAGASANAEFRFNFSAPWFEPGPGLAYESRLDQDDNWSLLSPTAHRTFTQLAPGRHVFHVRAVTPDGRRGPATSLAFAVPAPWWLMPWAALGLFTALAAGMAASLRWRNRALTRRSARLETLVATRTRELNDAKLAAENASIAKSTFLANMSHELRTPLNAILGYAQVLRREDGLSEKGRRQLGIVGRNGEHLLQMINEVLDLAKIEAGKMTLQPAVFPLARMLRTAADFIEQRALDKGLAFRLEIGAGLPAHVTADEAKLRQILVNLLGNAVKFTAQGEIVFAAARAGESVRFEVRDTGVGIAPDQLEAIFQPFHQAAGNRLSAQGTGLGLAISQRLAELCGGRIRVQSRPGAGSRFWLDLSLSETAAARQDPADDDRVTGYAGARRRLLVVDDEPTNRDVLRDLLEPLGFAVTAAAGGDACLAAIAAHPPDAVLLDLRMPGMDGFALAARLRAQPELRRLPLIALSASVLGFNQDDALAAGCDAFLPKPVQQGPLLETLARLLALEWIRRDAPPAADPGPRETSGALPPLAVLEALDRLARGGDLAELRDTIAAALARGGPGGAFLRRLDAMAAAFQTAGIREQLAQARDQAQP